MIFAAGPLRAQEPDVSDVLVAPAAEPAPAAPRRRPPPSPRTVAPEPQAAGAVEPTTSTHETETAPAAPTPPPIQARLRPGTPIPEAELQALVDGAVRQAMADRHVAGVTVAVVQNGHILLKKGYGLASLSPARAVDPDRTLFRVGSISKLFTWTLVMQQVERGRMRLDAPVNLFLPEPLQVRDRGYVRQVQLRDLMTHSAGFEDRTLGRLFELKADRVRPLNVYLRQEKPRRVSAPGMLPEYSNYGAGLAGAAAAQAAGLAYDDLVENDILRPLGLNHTTFREPYPADPALPAPMPTALAADAAQGLAWTGTAFVARPYEFLTQLAPAGAASSTAADMARWMTLILADGTLDGRTIYGPQTARAFRTVIQRSGPGVQGWAHGFMERPLPGGFASFGHLGQTLNFRSNLTTVPALDLGVFISANSDNAGDLVERLPDIIVGQFYAAPESMAAEGSAELYAQRAAYEGDYLDDDRRHGGPEQFVSMLTDVVKVSVSPDGRLLVSGQGAFLPTGAPGQFREIDGARRIAGFQVVGGQAARWLAPSGAKTFSRVGWIWRRRLLAWIALAAMTAASATLIGLFTRDRREFRQTSVQGRASAIQTATALLWFTALGGFGWWSARVLQDSSVAFGEWPGPWVLVASSAALVAALCSLGQVLMLPSIWRGGRRVESWTGWRKLRFSLTAFCFLAFSVMLALWGALEPWSA